MKVAPLLRASLAISCVLAWPGQLVAEGASAQAKRMGAYQCLDCVTGGYLSGIRQGGNGRVRREFPPNRRLCVASYRDIDGEQYVFFQLESMASKTDGAWTIRREGNSSGTNASGERYARIALDDAGWPDGGEWGVKSNSWNAECHDVQAQ
jgi:hypothetical protein